MDDKRVFMPTDGKEQEVDETQLTDEKVVAAAREGRGYLNEVPRSAAARFVQERWARIDKQARGIQNELRVNWLRFRGDSFAQVHPSDPNRIFVPNNARSRMPPSVNKLRRTVHRYVAQITADEPIIEGAPATHTPLAREQAEAATLALRGEWYRLKLNRELKRVQEAAAVLRSGFWHFEWDPSGGGKTKAQKFFKDEKGQNILEFVNSEGNKVEDPQDAATVWQGEMTVETLLPFNVRWSGGRTLDKADEVMVGKIITLGQLYEMSPEAREMKVKHFLRSVTPEQMEWMHEMRGAGGIAGRNRSYQDDELEKVGHTLTETSSLLDEPVLLINYYKKPSRAYPKGYHGLIAGEWTAYRGPLRYGLVPLAQFRCLDDLQDPLGLALVDLLKDPQELLDFVNGQVLRFLQAMKRRWFVPLTSGVSAKDLLNPTRSIIHYNSNSAPPTPEQTPELPSSLDKWMQIFEQEFDDQTGIHDTMQGKHVPGVSSGRHAEALRSGDETILGLTRVMAQDGIETAGTIMLAIAQKEWKSERKVRYFSGREYVEKAFNAADFGDTHTVQLKRGTLLMLTQAQKLETLYSYVEMGALTPDELRNLAPLVDTAGVSTTSDPHYMRARRENEVYLDGPPAELKRARKKYEEALEMLESDLQFAKDTSVMAGETDLGSTEAFEAVKQTVQVRMQIVEQEWGEAFSKHMIVSQMWEGTPGIARPHFEAHADALASKRADSLPVWWTEMFSNHAMEHLQALAPPPEPGAEGQGAPPPQGPPLP